MNLKKIEDTLNTEGFKEKVELLFSKSLRDEIDFDFTIKVETQSVTELLITAYDSSYDCDGRGIPTLKTVVPVTAIANVEAATLQGFKEKVETLTV